MSKIILDIAAASGESGEETAEESHSPALLTFEEMQGNPENPRPSLDKLQEKIDEKVASLNKHGQLHNINVLSLARFREVKPYLADQLTSAPFVVINGNLRHAALPRTTLDGLRYEVHDEWDADAIDEAVLAENVHGVEITPVAIARQLKRMLNSAKYNDGAGAAKTGEPSIRKLAEAIGKPHPWVQQRLDLLKLHPDLQDAVEAGKISFALARACPRLHPDLQPQLASEKLPSDVARAWVVKHPIGPDEQWRRWQAGEPFATGPLVELSDDVETGRERTKTARSAAPAFVFRVPDRTPRAVAVALVDACAKAEVDLDELISELAKAKISAS